jgi:hypothetical protein
MHGKVMGREMRRNAQGYNVRLSSVHVGYVENLPLTATILTATPGTTTSTTSYRFAESATCRLMVV